MLPDYLGYLQPGDHVYDGEQATAPGGTGFFLGQDDLPSTDGEILIAAAAPAIDRWAASLGEDATERLAIGRIRLAQHRFARDVMENWHGACAFCGFHPRALPRPNGLLRASHVKPWARSDNKERTDVRNGLAACPIHDAAFDQGYIGVSPDGRIVRSPALDRSIDDDDPRVSLYFGDALRQEIAPDAAAASPNPAYLAHHHGYVFRS